MDIVYTTGHYSMEIDGQQFADKTLEECKQIVHTLVDETADLGILQSFVEDFMELQYDEYKDLGTCSICEDWIEEYKYTTKK